MIRKLFDLLPFFGNNEVTPTEKLLQESLLPLGELDKTLPKKLFHYVMAGTEPEIVYTLNQLDADKITVLLDKPGTVDWWYVRNNSFNSSEYNKIIRQAINSRYKLYSEVGKTLTNEQVIRFAKVLAAACQDKNIKITTGEVPSWMLYLLCDALSTTLKSTSNEKLKLTHRTGWRIQLLADLIASEQGHDKGESILFAIFDRAEISEHYSLQLNIFFELPDFYAYIEEHAQFFRTTLVEKLSAPGLIQLLKYLSDREALRVSFSDVIVKLAIDQRKTVRNEAEPLLNILPASDVKTHLSDILFNGTPKQRSQAADLFARQGENKDILEHALQLEKSKVVIKSIESAITRFGVVDTAKNIELPDLPELTLLADTPLPESAKDILIENLVEMVEKAKINAEKEIEGNKSSKHKYKWAQNHYNEIKKISAERCRYLVDRLNLGNNGVPLSSEEVNVIKYKKRISNLPEFTLYHAMRVVFGKEHGNVNLSTTRIESEAPVHVLAGLELRQIESVLQKLACRDPAREVAKLCLESYNDGLKLFPKPEQLWPFFSQYPEYIAEALGLLPNKSENQYRQFELGHAFELLGKFPTIPAQFIPRIMELALGENKTFRVSAQQLLEKLPNVHVNAQESLHSAKQEIRITTIEWLARIKNKDSIAPLYALLKKEKRETVRAALLAALEQFGEDISPYLSEKILREEALKGLKANPPASMSWFDYSVIPPLKWENGKAVDADIIKWWIILAVKLKAPAGNTLLQRYVGLLAKESQHKLGNFILHTFIAQDVKNPSLEEAMLEAHKDAPERLKNYQYCFEHYGEYYQKYANYTLEQATEEIKHEVLRRYLGSAISEKGMLALTSHIEGHVAVSALRNYMRDHYPRRSQIEAMISAVAVSDDPIIIQLLLSLSRRYRTTAIQEKARELVKEIADRNGWSADELADRTIPTAGMDETGTLVLEYGERTFTARMDSKQRLVLLNPEGKEIKALPAARKTDNEEQIKDAKKLFSSSKKELKQIIDLQTARLYESMCAQRQWLSEDWQTYIMLHPVMRPLIERLVWQEVKDEQVLNTFRPTDDGCLINLEDDEVELSSGTVIQLAHAAVVDNDTREAWLAHFDDYKVTFLFSQMVNTVPEFDLKQVDVEDRKGWLTDTFTLRGVLTKIGYQRAPAEDGGSFSHYYKHFSSLDLYVNIGFSGSYVPEENIPAVLFDLSFEKNQQNYWDRNNLALQDVPPILLAESYADYLKVAQACSGFDADWENKTPW
ncbi:DUF4132 domain-containing protein [Pectobacterium wasabiae]|uniref:HEAT repeat protein n=1 Tax=Pectobacterium wasabiae TaxID=55208 RepID=A0AAW3EDP8_9GAMM|nr:DUF4132 domain-containing protein [Pectobacterium wasabiae]AOR62972.1 hypothetical protein A7983_06830 [Pectobacterium wasabiae CFBP 3304]EJS92270.1 Hypothetical protein Y17_4770 [Pectobacterium wasabiae CFBP 3304]EJS92338.1 Hypothetical protein Y17_4554 [Pectobacterium wasabiae CFBP 3304]KFX03018.1 HEAT repeat protein [Pectobacterium wasabiae]KGA26687.1 HEAT repeat protein [Pectobacterium wasabiae]